VQGNQPRSTVRTRLAGGGNRIRTIGPAANGTAMGGPPSRCRGQGGAHGSRQCEEDRRAGHLRLADIGEGEYRARQRQRQCLCGRSAVGRIEERAAGWRSTAPLVEARAGCPADRGEQQKQVSGDRAQIPPIDLSRIHECVPEPEGDDQKQGAYQRGSFECAAPDPPRNGQRLAPHN
jgi:hypothetical protein